MEKIKLTLQMPFKSKEEAHKAYLSLKPELDFKGRAKITLEEIRDTHQISVHIEADDLPSLHAAVGSQLRALKVIAGVQNFAEE